MAPLDADAEAELIVDTRVEADGTRIVTISGELDTSNTDSLSPVVATVASEKPPRLIFDIGGLRFLDSAGIATLLEGATHAGATYLRNPTPIVRRVVEISGLTTVLRPES
jgi:anti-anti-sigma factor